MSATAALATVDQVTQAIATAATRAEHALAAASTPEEVRTIQAQVEALLSRSRKVHASWEQIFHLKRIWLDCIRKAGAGLLAIDRDPGGRPAGNSYADRTSFFEHVMAQAGITSRSTAADWQYASQVPEDVYQSWIEAHCEADRMLTLEALAALGRDIQIKFDLGVVKQVPPHVDPETGLVGVVTPRVLKHRAAKAKRDQHALCDLVYLYLPPNKKAEFLTGCRRLGRRYGIPETDITRIIIRALARELAAYKRDREQQPGTTNDGPSCSDPIGAHDVAAAPPPPPPSPVPDWARVRRTVQTDPHHVAALVAGASHLDDFITQALTPPPYTKASNKATVTDYALWAHYRTWADRTGLTERLGKEAFGSAWRLTSHCAAASDLRTCR